MSLVMFIFESQGRNVHRRTLVAKWWKVYYALTNFWLLSWKKRVFNRFVSSVIHKENIIFSLSISNSFQVKQPAGDLILLLQLKAIQIKLRKVWKLKKKHEMTKK